MRTELYFKVEGAGLQRIWERDFRDLAKEAGKARVPYRYKITEIYKKDLGFQPDRLSISIFTSIFSFSGDMYLSIFDCLSTYGLRTNSYSFLAKNEYLHYSCSVTKAAGRIDDGCTYLLCNFEHDDMYVVKITND
jgi:hypothetical protein